MYVWYISLVAELATSKQNCMKHKGSSHIIEITLEVIYLKYIFTAILSTHLSLNPYTVANWILVFDLTLTTKETLHPTIILEPLVKIKFKQKSVFLLITFFSLLAESE